MKTLTKSNRLINESSPYLRQHAQNPVDWYPWGPEALSKAKKDKKPIFLSIGYSACHWCHVMERESFENEEIAAFLNEHFVSIKVDREERPDLDQIYMNVVQLMTGHGGWPMSMFLTPEQKPIFGGTYYPPQDRMGMPGFLTVLKEVLRIFQENPPALKEQTEKILEVLQQISTLQGGKTLLEEKKLVEVAQLFLANVDEQHGGFGGAPKFPQTMALTFLLQMYFRTQDKKYLKPVQMTLTKMARGGIYDQIGGGFARYSVDERWAVPHFEKMLYDNALLANLYGQTYQATKENLMKEICCGILDFVLREMSDENGGFYSSYDADSEGEEGKFYVWDPSEIKNVLGDKDGELICNYYGVDEAGNFENGKTVLAVKGDKIDSTLLKRAIQNLYQQRSKRVSPGLDNKILTSWNALMIRGFAKGYAITQDKRYWMAAKGCAEFLMKNLSDDSNRLFVTIKDGNAKLPAYLDEYVFFIAALIDLFELSGELSWLMTAKKYNSVVLEQFKDPNGSGFFFTAKDHEELIQRPKNFYDGSIPSGISVQLENLHRLSILFRDAQLMVEGERQLQSMLLQALDRPLGMSNTLVAADLYLGPSREVVVIPPKSGFNEHYQKVIAEIQKSYLPRATIILRNPQVEFTQYPTGMVELFQGREALEDKASVYICEGSTCSLPLTSLEDLQKTLH